MWKNRWKISVGSFPSFLFARRILSLTVYSAKFKEISEKNLTKKDRVNIII